jgi:hypothetical protein
LATLGLLLIGLAGLGVEALSSTGMWHPFDENLPPASEVSPKRAARAIAGVPWMTSLAAIALSAMAPRSAYRQ